MAVRCASAVRYTIMYEWEDTRLAGANTNRSYGQALDCVDLDRRFNRLMPRIGAVLCSLSNTATISIRISCVVEILL